MERERLASLGQLIGGIAHNLKTPIMSISGAAEGIQDLIKEYDASIGDPEVTQEDHHEIAKDMAVWVEKIRSHTEYMSDVITAVKGQAVNFSQTTNHRIDIFNGCILDQIPYNAFPIVQHIPVWIFQEQADRMEIDALF